MQRFHFIFGLVLVLAGSPAAFAAPDSHLAQLAVSEGHWVYHGHTFGDAGEKPAKFVWNADCRWAANRAFMMCSFSNSWGGRHIDSLVVDTFNHHDNSFWHYEIFADGDAADKPFASKMSINGSTRSEEWTQTSRDKTSHLRIVYEFASDKKVKVSFQQSADGKTWKTTAVGTGEKTGP
jgi:hypothetical protein